MQHPESPEKLTLPAIASQPLDASSLAPEGRTRRSKWVRLLAGMICLGLLAWGGKRWLLATDQKIDVLTAEATVGTLIITVSDRGELESSKSVQVACELEGGGKLVSIVAEGTQVKKGEEVARIDTDSLLKVVNEQEVKYEQAEGKVKSLTSALEVQRNKAESEIAKAQLTLTLAKIDYEAYEEAEYLVELDKKKTALETGRKELKEAEDHLEFTRTMVKKGFAQLDQIRVMEMTSEGKRFAARQAETELRVLEKFSRIRKITELKAKSEDAQRELDRTKKSQTAATEMAESDLAAAKRTTELEQKHLERLKKQIDKCILLAPQDGIVIYFKRPWDETARIRPGATLFFQQPIYTLPDLNQMSVKLKLHESIIKKVSKKQTATMQVEALANRLLHGKVTNVATLAQNNDWGNGGGVKEYQTDVSVEDLPSDAGLRPGMTAEVKILIKTIPDALKVPVQAVTESDGVHYCFVVSGNSVERREIEIGDGNDLHVQVVSGLKEGEKVALDARARAAAELQTKTPKASK
jgi:HlyD family secretion protein